MEKFNGRECSRCGNRRYVVKHHQQYSEIAGKDVIVYLCRSCNAKLHNKMRKEARWHISPENMKRYKNERK